MLFFLQTDFNTHFKKPDEFKNLTQKKCHTNQL